MNKKINELIQNLTKIHKKIIKKYNNIEVIQGQYRPKLKTIAKILKEQTQHKLEIYERMLMDASELEIEITDEGHQEVLNLTKKCEESISKCMENSDDDIVRTADEFSSIKIELFNNVLDILNRYESDKDIKHEALKEKIILILALEEKDHATLHSFKIRNDQP